MEKVRCSNCRGAKKVPKLGGMIGECNGCKGTGVMDACDRPVLAKVEPAVSVNSLIEQVSECLPVVEQNEYEEPTAKPFQSNAKKFIDAMGDKKISYKRKQG